MNSLLNMLNQIPSGLWAFVGVAIGLWVNSRKEKRAEHERQAMRTEERLEREALRNEEQLEREARRNQERLAAWKAERLQAHARFMNAVRQASDAMSQFISEDLSQPEALERMESLNTRVSGEHSQLELIATDEVANAAMECLQSLHRAQLFLCRYSGPPNPYADGEDQEASQGYSGLEETLGFWEDPFQVVGGIGDRYRDFVTAARKAQGLDPIEYSFGGL